VAKYNRLMEIAATTNPDLPYGLAASRVPTVG
jgi:hypothetical protein